MEVEMEIREKSRKGEKRGREKNSKRKVNSTPKNNITIQDKKKQGSNN